MSEAELLGQVLELLRSPAGANRNMRFLEYSSNQGQAVLRLYRQYQSLSRELEQAAARGDMRVSCLREGNGLRLLVEDPRVSYRRQCLVPAPLAGHFLELLGRLGLAGQTG